MTTATETPTSRKPITTTRSYHKGDPVEGWFGDYRVFDPTPQRTVLISTLQEQRGFRFFMWREIHDLTRPNHLTLIESTTIFKEKPEFDEYLEFISQYQGAPAI